MHAFYLPVQFSGFDRNPSTFCFTSGSNNSMHSNNKSLQCCEKLENYESCFICSTIFEILYILQILQMLNFIL